jgi:hypothetical protein
LAVAIDANKELLPFVGVAGGPPFPPAPIVTVYEVFTEGENDEVK